jgi:hypothetical protein
LSEGRDALRPEVLFRDSVVGTFLSHFGPDQGEKGKDFFEAASVELLAFPGVQASGEFCGSVADFSFEEDLQGLLKLTDDFASKKQKDQPRLLQHVRVIENLGFQGLRKLSVALVSANAVGYSGNLLVFIGKGREHFLGQVGAGEVVPFLRGVGCAESDIVEKDAWNEDGIVDGVFSLRDEKGAMKVAHDVGEVVMSPCRLVVAAPSLQIDGEDPRIVPDMFIQGWVQEVHAP